MSEIKFNLKGPAGAVIGIIIIGVIVYFRYFIPFAATAQDKEAIRQELEQMRVADMSMISKASVDHYKNTGKVMDQSKDIRNLTGKIAITDIHSKKSLFSGIKIKVSYTIDGKIPKTDGGVRYFRLHRRERSQHSLQKAIDLYPISEDDYVK